MNISENDKIFKYLKEGERGDTERFAYYGWEGKGKQGFYNYLIGYKAASDAIFNAFLTAAKAHRIDIQDTIVFPLCSNYRHATELFVKYLFVKHSNSTEDELKTFFNNNHNILDAWEATKPIVEELLKRQNSKIELKILDHYITEINKNDENSTAMRYPISKRLTASHECSKRLDIVLLKEKMDEFFLYLRRLDSEIEDQLLFFPYDEIIRKRIEQEFEENKIEIAKIIRKLIKYAKNRVVLDKPILDTDDIIYLAEQNKEIHNKIFDYLYDLSDNQIIIIMLLFYSARDVFYGSCNLAKNKEERITDFYKLLLTNIEEVNLRFDKPLNDKEHFIETIIASPRECVKYLKFSINEINGFENTIDL